MPISREERTYYVSLGDSISIDAYAGGPGRGGASLLYRNRDEDFPEWRGRDLQTRLPGTRMIPLAMDGATSSTVRFAQIPRFKEMNVRPSVVTLTMGGNDLLQTFGDEHSAQTAHRALEEHGRVVLSQLRQMAGPDAPIIVGTIYDPTDGTGNAGAMEMPAWPEGLAWLARFNETLRTLAQEQGALVADIHGLFQGHGLRAGSPAQLDPRPPSRTLWYLGGIEPNAWGASGVRAAFWDALDASGFLAKAGNGGE